MWIKTVDHVSKEEDLRAPLAPDVIQHRTQGGAIAVDIREEGY